MDGKIKSKQFQSIKETFHSCGYLCHVIAVVNVLFERHNDSLEKKTK